MTGLTALCGHSGVSVSWDQCRWWASLSPHGDISLVVVLEYRASSSKDENSTSKFDLVWLNLAMTTFTCSRHCVDFVRTSISMKTHDLPQWLDLTTMTLVRRSLPKGVVIEASLL